MDRPEKNQIQILKPVYLKNSEIQTDKSNKITDFEIAEGLMEKVEDVRCVQLDRDLWRIYVASHSSRSTLLTEGFDIRSRNVQVYDNNPYSVGIRRPDEQVLKVTIKGVPISVDDTAVKHMLEKLGVTMTSNIKYEKIRNPHNLKMTDIANGNRFVYVKPLEEKTSLPRHGICAGLPCSIFHKGQPSVKKTPRCNRCWSNDHFTNQCTNNKCCKVCKKPGHEPGDNDCEFYTEPKTNIVAFNGKNNILSNFYPSEIKVFGVVHKSAEHAYQYTKAMRTGDTVRATMIQEAPTAYDAKMLGNKVATSDQFEDTKVTMMQEILDAKAAQVQEFHETLLNSHPKTSFVESTFDEFWGSGLDKHGTVNTDSKAWPGINKLGRLIGKLAKQIRKNNPAENSTNSAKTKTTSTNSRQLRSSRLTTPERERSSSSDSD